MSPWGNGMSALAFQVVQDAVLNGASVDTIAARVLMSLYLQVVLDLQVKVQGSSGPAQVGGQGKQVVCIFS